ncbi:hypothetical protein K8T06_08045 [bacterium]|nr:hypothetical protein [bacterium]
MEFEYDETTVCYHKVLSKVTHKSGQSAIKSANLVYSYTYHGPRLTGDRSKNVGLLKTATLPTGLVNTYTYTNRNVVVNEYDGNADENPHSISQEIKALRTFVSEDGNSYIIDYDDAQIHTTAIFEGATSGQVRKYIYRHTSDPGELEHKYGELLEIQLQGNSKDVLFSTLFLNEEVDMGCQKIHPCAPDLKPKTLRSRTVTNTEIGLPNRVLTQTISYEHDDNFPQNVAPQEMILSDDTLNIFNRTEITEYHEYTDGTHKIYLPKKTRNYINTVEYVDTDYVYYPDLLLNSSSVEGVMHQYNYTADRILYQVILPNNAIIDYSTGLIQTGTISDGDKSFSFTTNFNNRGQVVSTTDINSNLSTIDLDDMGRPLEITHPVLDNIGITYPSSCQVNMTQGEQASKTLFDNHGRFTKSENKADTGNAYNFAIYGDFGAVSNQSIIRDTDYAPNKGTDISDTPGFYDFQRDIIGRPLKIYDPVDGGNVLDVSYSPFTKTTTNSKNETSTYQYDAVGQLVKEFSPEGLVTQYKYDYMGNLLQVSQDNQNRYFSYNKLGQLYYEYQPETHSINYYYSENGNRNLIQVQYSDGSYKTLHDYDILNRPEVIKYFGSDGILEREKNLIYDNDPLPTLKNFDMSAYSNKNRSCSNGTIHAMLSKDGDGDGNVVSINIWSDYNSFGKPGSKTTIIPDSNIEMTAAFEYDHLTDGSKYGNLIKITLSGNVDGTSIGPLTLDYGRRDSTGSLNSISLNSNLVVSSITHDASGGIVNALLANGTLINAAYNDGNYIETKNEGSQAFNYTYDLVNYIEGIGQNSQDVNYEYDGLGRLTYAEYKVDDDDYKYSYEYDSNNNMVKFEYIENDETPETYLYIYDISRLVGVDETCTNTFRLVDDDWLLPIVSNELTGREGFAICQTTGSGLIMLFGGEDSVGFKNDTWIFNGTSWMDLVITPDYSPSARRDHAMVYNEIIGKVVLFGGVDSNMTVLNDTWIWDGVIWEELFIDDQSFDGLNPVMCRYDDTLMLICDDNICYTLEETENGWTWQEIPEITALTCSVKGIAWNEASQQVILVSETSTWCYPDANGEWENLGFATPSNHIRSLVYDATDQKIKCVTEVSTGDGEIYCLEIDEGQTYFDWTTECCGPSSSDITDMYLVSIGSNRNQLAKFVFDARGKRVSDGCNRYIWNSANELLEILDVDTQDLKGTFTYSPSGKRILSKWHPGGDEVYRMYLGETPVLDIKQDGTYRVYIHGDGRLFATADYTTVIPPEDPEMRYYLLDHLGSTISILDSDGNPVWPSTDPESYQRYEPFGKFADNPGEGSKIPTFTGKFADPNTGNHYFNARYYGSDGVKLDGPVQFTSPDPISGNVGNPMSWNRYAYCQNNPVMFTDSTGRVIDDEQAMNFSLPQNYFNRVKEYVSPYWQMFNKIQVYKDIKSRMMESSAGQALWKILDDHPAEFSVKIYGSENMGDTAGSIKNIKYNGLGEVKSAEVWLNYSSIWPGYHEIMAKVPNDPSWKDIYKFKYTLTDFDELALSPLPHELGHLLELILFTEEFKFSCELQSGYVSHAGNYKSKESRWYWAIEKSQEWFAEDVAESIITELRNQ